MRTRKANVKNIGRVGDRKDMVAVQAIVSAATIALVLFATRLTIEIDASERD